MLLFLEKLHTATANRYTFLRLNSAEFYKGKKLLKLRFIYPCEVAKQFVEDDKNTVLREVRNLYAGAEVEIDFVKSFGDSASVTNKVVEYINTNHKLILQQLSTDNISVETSSSYIKVTISAPTSVYKIFESADIEQKLKAELDKWFSSDISVNLIEIPTDLNAAFDTDIDRAKITLIGSTLVSVTSLGSRIFGSAKRDMSFAGNPSQICTITQASGKSGIALCGRVSMLSKSNYKNEDYDPENPQKTKRVGNYDIVIKPETYIYKWVLNDTTGNIECVVYRDNDDGDLNQLKEGDVIVATGGVIISQKTGLPSFRPKAAWFASIDFDSIVRQKEIKSVPKKYHTVSPELYRDDSKEQLSIFEQHTEAPTPAYLKGKTIVVFDLETTGRDSVDVIVEMAAVKMVDGKLKETFYTLVNPERPIPKEASDVHGILDDDVIDAPTIKQVLPDFFKFVQDAELAGHNIIFDYSFIKRAGDKLGYDFQNQLIDTLALAKQYIRGQENNTLTELCKHVGIELNGAHRAMNDTVATAKLLVEIARHI